MFNSYDSNAFGGYHINYDVHGGDTQMTISGCSDPTGSILSSGDTIHNLNGLTNSIPYLPQYTDSFNSRKQQGVFHAAESIPVDQFSAGIMAQSNDNCSYNYNYTHSTKPRTQGEYEDVTEWRRRASAPALFAFNQLMSSSQLGTATTSNNHTNEASGIVISKCNSKPSLPSFSMTSSHSPLPTSSAGINTPPGSTSSSVASIAVDYLMSDQCYTFAYEDQQQQHRINHVHLQQQQQEAIAGNCSHDTTPPQTPLMNNGFHGVACGSDNNSQSSALSASQFPPWNNTIASPTSSFPLSSIPATPTTVAWANEENSTSVSTSNLQHQLQPQQQQIQLAIQGTIRTLNDSLSHVHENVQKQRRRKQLRAQLQDLHIAISTTSSTYPSMGLSSCQTNTSVPHSLVSSPHLSAANSIHAQNHPWSTSSPAESTSGTSTPSFPSLSPSMSFSAARDIGSGDASRQSSRAPSPSFTQYHTFGPGVDGHPHDHRLVKLELSEPESCSKVIVHSRKSSTSSISSITSTRQRRLSAIGDSISSSGSHASTAAAASTNPTPSAHQCSTCGQRFAGPAVLIRHMESIHEKLLWSCVGCKSNLSRRDAVTRHINLSPMDSICRTVGRIGQIKTLNGVEVHYEISSYRAKPLEEVMNRMGKKIPVELKKGSDTVKGRGAIAAASGCEWPEEVLLNRHVEEDSKVDIKIEDCEDEGLGPYKKRRRHMLEVNQRKK